MGLLSRALLGGAVGSGMGYLLSPEDRKVEGAIAGGLGGSGGGLLSRFVRVDPTKLGTFGGSLAKTADHQALAKAQALEVAGASRDDIWDATGWFKGVDGKWRFEIDDSGAKLAGYDKGPLRAALDHPELYRAYPDLGRVQTQIGGRGGAYIPPGKYNDEMIQASADDARSILLHEAGGHGVQHREGFARGGNTDTPEVRQMVSSQHAASQQAAQQRYNKLLGEMWAFQDEAIKSAPRKDNRAYKKLADVWRQKFPEKAREMDETFQAAYSSAPNYHEGYRRLAGETEARNVQTRDAMRMRGEKPGRPWETQDVPDDQQIVRFR